MSAAAARAAFAEIGRDLIANGGPASARRVAPLLVAATPAPATQFVVLEAVPAWLRWPHDRLERLSRAVALRSLSATLATTIDGALLGAVASAAGEDMLDWAIASAPAANVGEAPLPAFAADSLTRIGFAILRAGLAPQLRGYLDWTSGDVAEQALPAIVEDAVAFVERDTA